MKMKSRTCLTLLALSIAMPSVAAKDPNISAIKARQGEMAIRAFNTEPLFAMAKGKMPYDAELASKLAANLKLLLDLDTSRDWPPGTGIDNYPNKTHALPKIWTTYPEIGKYGKKYAQAVNELNEVAGKGLDAMGSKVGALGKSCKGCHDEYQEDH